MLDQDFEELFLNIQVLNAEVDFSLDYSIAQWVRLGVHFNDPAKALACFQRVLEQDPAHQEALLRQASLYLIYGNDQLAIECYKRLCELETNPLKSCVSLIKCAFQADQYALMDEYFERAYTFAKQSEEKIAELIELCLSNQLHYEMSLIRRDRQEPNHSHDIHGALARRSLRLYRRAAITEADNKNFLRALYMLQRIQNRDSHIDISVQRKQVLEGCYAETTLLLNENRYPELIVLCRELLKPDAYPGHTVLLARLAHANYQLDQPEYSLFILGSINIAIESDPFVLRTLANIQLEVVKDLAGFIATMRALHEHCGNDMSQEELDHDLEKIYAAESTLALEAEKAEVEFDDAPAFQGIISDAIVAVKSSFEARFKEKIEKVKRPLDNDGHFKEMTMNQFEDECDLKVASMAEEEANRIIADYANQDSPFFDLNVHIGHIQDLLINTYYGWRQVNTNEDMPKKSLKKMKMSTVSLQQSTEEEKEKPHARSKDLIDIYRERLENKLRAHDIPLNPGSKPKAIKRLTPSAKKQSSECKGRSSYPLSTRILQGSSGIFSPAPPLMRQSSSSRSIGLNKETRELNLYESTGGQYLTAMGEKFSLVLLNKIVDSITNAYKAAPNSEYIRFTISLIAEVMGNRYAINPQDAKTLIHKRLHLTPEELSVHFEATENDDVVVNLLLRPLKNNGILTDEGVLRDKPQNQQMMPLGRYLPMGCK